MRQFTKPNEMLEEFLLVEHNDASQGVIDIEGKGLPPRI